MVNTIAFLLIVFGIMFLIGIAMAILALYFNIKMKHPIFSNIFSIILIPLICIPIQFTGGILISRCMLIIALIYSVAMIVMAVKISETIVEYALFMRMPSLSRQAA